MFLKEINQLDKLEEVMALNEQAEDGLKIIDERMLVLIDRVRENGYKTALISNTTLESTEDMRSAGLAEHFDVFITSAEVGIIKPDPEIFKLVFNALNIEPSEFIFIDDAERSLSTAGETGFKPLLFKSYEQLVDDLRQLAVEI